MQDRETNSLWSHITGEAMEGEMKGAQYGENEILANLCGAPTRVEYDSRLLFLLFRLGDDLLGNIGGDLVVAGEFSRVGSPTLRQRPEGR